MAEGYWDLNNGFRNSRGFSINMKYLYIGTKSIHSDTLETLTWSTILKVASFFLTLTVCLILIIVSDAKNVRVTIVEKPQIKISFCKITWISFSYLIRQAFKVTVVIRTCRYKWRVTWHSFYSFFKESIFIFWFIKTVIN